MIDFDHMTKEQLVDYYWELGHYLGYPDCCIEDFIDRMWCDEQKCSEIQSQVSCNTGFVPCLKCAKKILKGETTLLGLIQNRRSLRRFPILVDGESSMIAQRIIKRYEEWYKLKIQT